MFMPDWAIQKLYEGGLPMSSERAWEASAAGTGWLSQHHRETSRRCERPPNWQQAPFESRCEYFRSSGTCRPLLPPDASCGWLQQGHNPTLHQSGVWYEKRLIALWENKFPKRIR